MIDFGKNFKESFKLLIKKPYGIIPFSIVQLLFYVYLFSFLFFSGLSDIMLAAQNVDNLDREALAKINFAIESIDYNKLVLNMIGGFFLYIIIATLFSSIGFYINAYYLKNFNEKNSEKFNFKIINAISKYPKFLGLRLLFLFAYFVPVLLLFFLTLIIMRFNILFGSVFLIIDFIFMIFWLIFVTSRFYFSEAILFFGNENKTEHKSISKIVKSSFNISEGKFFRVLLIILVIYGFSYMLNSLVSQPFYFLMGLLSKLGEAFANPIFYIVVLILVLFQGVIFTFSNLLFLRAYIQFLDDEKK